MADVKLTKKVKFEMLKEVVEGADVENKDLLVEFLDREIELASKKRTAKTATQKANEVLVEKVFEALVEAGKAVTVTEFYNDTNIEGVTSTQKLSALFKKLVDAGRVNKVVDKKKSYFSVAEDAEVAE